MKALTVLVALVPLVSVARADSPPTHCGTDLAPLAVKLAAKPDKSDPVLALDGDLKKYFALTFPTGLDFDPAKKAVNGASMKKFNDWFTARTQAAQQLSTKYTALLSSGTPEQKIEVAARLGQVTEDFAHVLETAEIPVNVRKGEFAAEASKAFCDGLNDQAQPLVSSAVDKYTACSTKAKDLSISNEFSAWCDARVAALSPKP